MITLSDELMAEAIEAAADICEMDEVSDYGYGGEIYYREAVSNWHDVVVAILSVVDKASATRLM